MQAHTNMCHIHTVTNATLLATGVSITPSPSMEVSLLWEMHHANAPTRWGGPLWVTLHSEVGSLHAAPMLPSHHRVQAASDAPWGGYTAQLGQKTKVSLLRKKKSQPEHQILAHKGFSWARETPGQWRDSSGAVSPHRRHWWGLGFGRATVAAPTPTKSSLGSTSNHSSVTQVGKQGVGRQPGAGVAVCAAVCVYTQRGCIFEGGAFHWLSAKLEGTHNPETWRNT